MSENLAEGILRKMAGGWWSIGHQCTPDSLCGGIETEIELTPQEVDHLKRLEEEAAVERDRGTDRGC